MAKNANAIGPAKVYHREETLTVGIRITTPFRGMFAEVDKLRRKLTTWFGEQGIQPAGPSFLRYHVIDMGGEMDIEYGTCVNQPVKDDGVVLVSAIPNGRYASLIYSGSGLQSNKALLQYIKENNLSKDSWNTSTGEAFACRYEMYLTDPKIESRKTKWEIEVAIKLLG